MEPKESTFTVTRAERLAAPITFVQQGVVLGRLPSCHVVLNHPSVSRMHAGINKLEDEYYLINLSLRNTLTINGRLIPAEQADILADGDIVQIGPFTVEVMRDEDSLSLMITHQVTGNVTTGDLPQQALPKRATGQLGTGRLTGRLSRGKLKAADVSSVLKVFWEKRTREKSERLSPLHPREKPLPGKARINWRPTNDLRRAWPGSIFVWAIVLLGGLAVFAAFGYSSALAPAALSSAHASSTMVRIDAEAIAKRPNANSCTTCHNFTTSIVTACAECHQGAAFHSEPSEAHVEAGITCTACHTEHHGSAFQPRATAFDTCSGCHNDGNKQLYNGKRVFTPHAGDAGYPVREGQWIWTGLSNDEISVLPEVAAQENDKDSEQVSRSKQFHSLHLYRVKLVEGLNGDKDGALSCSSCHKSFAPIDRETPRTTCVQCHYGIVGGFSGLVTLDSSRLNCTSCHVQHVLDKDRWGALLTAEARNKRADAIGAKIKERSSK